MQPRSLVYGNMFVVLVIISFLLRIALIEVFPPLLDVYYYDVQAVNAIISGTNPYGHLYTGIPDWLATPGASNVYTYYPAVFLFLVPFGLLGDIRLGLITADIVIAWTIFVMMGKRSRALTLLYLLIPFTALFSTVYPNNTLIAMLFIGLSIAMERAGKGTLSSIFLGISIASSQFAILAFPFFAYYYLKEGKLSRVLISVAVALLIFLPFAVWNFNAFFYDTFTFQFARQIRTLVMPAKIGVNLNPSLAGIVYTFLGVEVPSFVRIALTILALLAFMTRVRDVRSMIMNCSFFLAAASFLLPNDFSWWFLELPFQLFLTSMSYEV